MNYAKARQILLNNARKASKDHEEQVRGWEGLVKAACDEGKLYIPGYIPYIGSKYFSPQTIGRRTLVYALSQNLTSESCLARVWAIDWCYEDGELALDRQNKGFKSNGGAMMHPFDTGHIPIICALLRSIIGKKHISECDSIYDEIAATNLSKYSFRTKKGKTTDNMRSLRSCFDWFSKKEIEVLQPDYIFCLGDNVYRIISEKLPGVSNWNGCIIKVAFPSLQVINRYYGKQPTSEHISDRKICAMLSEKDLERKVDYHNKVLSNIVERERDAYYFAEMHKRIKCKLRSESQAPHSKNS